MRCSQKMRTKHGRFRTKRFKKKSGRTKLPQRLHYIKNKKKKPWKIGSQITNRTFLSSHGYKSKRIHNYRYRPNPHNPVNPGLVVDLKDLTLKWLLQILLLFVKIRLREKLSQLLTAI